MEDNDCRWYNLNDIEFQRAFRMSKTTVIDLQAEIDYYEDRHVNRINTILLACLWFLGNTRPFEDVGKIFKITNIEFAVRTYLLKILKLAKSYILWPTNEESKLIEHGFSSEFQFPGIVGIIGSLHIEINGHEELNSDIYYNTLMQKHTFVIQLVCDNNLLLRDVCIGCPGGRTIKDILESSPLFTMLTDEKGLLIKNGQHLLGGTEHPELSTLLIPYKTDKKGELTERQYKFNVLHNTAMCTVERTLRCLENRFPRIMSMDKLRPEFASIIASCVCILHNFTRIRDDECGLYL